MILQPPPAASLETLRSADRLAQAASRWLQLEQAPGDAFRGPGPGHRDLLAGLIAGLGDRLAVDEATVLLAAYSLALLEHEQEAAVDTPLRVGGRSPLTPDYVEGLRIADRLVAALGSQNTPPPP